MHINIVYFFRLSKIITRGHRSLVRAICHFFDCRKHGSGLGVKAVVSVTWFCFCFSDKGTSWRCLRLSFLMTVKLFIVIQWFLFIVTQRMCSLDRYYITCTVYFSLSRVSPGYLFVKELKSCTSKRVSTFSENKLIHFSVIDEKQKKLQPLFMAYVAMSIKRPFTTIRSCALYVRSNF